LKRAYTVLAGVTVTVAFLLVFVFVVEPYFLNPDKTLYNNAISLQNQGNYAAAIEKFQTLEDTYPSSYYAVICFNDSFNCNYQYISSLIADEKYPEAQLQYVQLLDEYPITYATPERDSVLKDMPASVLFDWAENVQSQNVTVALRVYDVAVKYHPGTNYATDAETAIVNLQLEKIAAEGKSADFSTPYQKSAKALDGNAQLTVVNDSPYPMEVFLKGETTQRIIIEGSPNSTTLFPNDLLGQIRSREQANRASVTLAQGTYEMAVKTNMSRGMYGAVTFPGNTEYEYIFYLTTK